MPRPARHPVITGMGAIAPGALDTDAFWKAALAGTCSLRRITRYDPTSYPLALAGEIEGFVPSDVIDSRIVVQTDLFTQIALAAADLALRDANLDPATLPRYAFGAVTASCAGGVEFGQSEIQRLWSLGPGHVGPYQSIAWFYAATTGQISIRYGLRGPCGVLVTDEAGGLDAVAQAARDIRYGSVAMLAGGAEAPLAPFSMACQYPHGLLSTASDPTRAYLPFSASAHGFVPAEGGAMLVVEQADAARERRARVRARVVGHGATYSDPRGTRPADTVGALARAVESALAAAGCAPGEVDVVFADGLGVREADQVEEDALRRVFGRRPPPVTVPKAGYGRAYAGAAALDTVLAVLSLEHGLIPPTPNVTDPSTGLDLVVGDVRPADLRTALVLARGLSGNNSALVLERASPSS
jgi:minimal PKS chain-length factor (CLF/KS beta)